MINPRSLFIVIPFALSIACTQTRDQQRDQQPETAILAAMEKQELAWNAGDIRTFMETYWRDDSLLFVGGGGPVYGWQQTLDRYLTTYPDTAAMGKLRFDILEIRRLAPDRCFVLGKWQLTRTIGDASGHFTLLFEKIDDEWLITVDHSS